ncbi:LysR family transcriptional regulator [uncultured Roseobacter sp.]|uniref:LysR family transcriptional regulator n=1 Tax=uncultured Roseobacter sp. TaxID=114847 RepID=UPI00262DA831|nr:LysR family transcriptional regulator [uncultured Roseobacter sp.]
MSMKGVTLRGLEVFEALAGSGSVAKAALRTGLSQPAVSQQMRNLESALNIELMDHSRRPMRLTPAGKTFLARAERALGELRQAQSEMTVMDLAHVRSLSIGIIDDFDDNITPRLATILADSLKDCSFRMITASSHDLVEAVSERRLQLAVSAVTGNLPDGIREYPLARDPFVAVVPRDAGMTTGSLFSPGSPPLLRYDSEQLISAQTEAELERQHLTPPKRFEIGSHLALMAMVARSIGWAMTTPLGYMRAMRFHGEIEAIPLPFTTFARQISLITSQEWDGDVPRDIAATMRRLMKSQVIDPATSELPFLTGELRILES